MFGIVATMGTLSRLAKQGRIIAVSAVEVATGIAAGVVTAVGWILPIGLGLFGIALLLIAMRELFLESIPLAKESTTFVADLWLVVVEAFKFIHPVVKAVLDVLTDVAEFLDSIGGPDFTSILDVFRSLFAVPDEISDKEMNDWLQNILDTCVGYDDPWFVIASLIKFRTHAYACAVARFWYPVPWVHAIIDPVLRLVYSGASDPIVDHYAVPGHHNCEHSVGGGAPVDVTCAIIAAGFVLLEVILPVLAGLLLLVWCGRPLGRIVWAVLTIAYILASVPLSYVFKLLVG
ncbi:hypothetical protein [Nereida ignava]|uniref:hypothetical protein n=1 Tax=Nereida ignava TaxID=282199 RepID=UPI0030F90369